MNQRQKIVLISTVFIIISMGIFPPWKRVTRTSLYQSSHDLGYWWVTSPPGKNGTGEIDFGRLLLQWTLVLMSSGTLIYLYKKGHR